MIKDSGERREFETGAVRDIQEGKGRCDLLPLKIISDRLESRELTFIDDYIRIGDIHSLWFALDRFSKNYESMIDMIIDVSRHYEEGAVKYGDRNWEKGIPMHCYIDSGVRHLLKYMRGDIDERHDRAFVWNMLGAIWTHENKPGMIDLPFKDKFEADRQFDCE